MKVVICMPTGYYGIRDEAVIRDALLTVVNRITLCDERSGEFEADDNRNIVTFGVEDPEFVVNDNLPTMERYSVVVRFCNGVQRGYIVRAQDRKEAMRKLVDKVDMVGISEINIAEVLLEEDEF